VVGGFVFLRKGVGVVDGMDGLGRDVVVVHHILLWVEDHSLEVVLGGHFAGLLSTVTWASRRLSDLVGDVGGYLGFARVGRTIDGSRPGCLAGGRRLKILSRREDIVLVLQKDMMRSRLVVVAMDADRMVCDFVVVES